MLNANKSAYHVAIISWFSIIANPLKMDSNEDDGAKRLTPSHQRKRQTEATSEVKAYCLFRFEVKSHMDAIWYNIA